MTGKMRKLKKKKNIQDEMRNVVRLVKSKSRFLITTHVNPDGDGLGAESALFLALKKLRKKVWVVNHDPLPKRFDYLPFTPSYKVSDAMPPHEVCFVLDAGDFSRVRENAQRSEFGILVNVDHHYSNNRFGDFNLINPNAAATGEIVYDLVRALGVKVDKGIAESVYTSLVTDTGRFRYTNTTHGVLRLAADLVEAGANASKVSERIFGDISWQAMSLTRLALESIEISDGGRIASMTLSQADFRKSGASDEDTENLINLVRNLDSVKIAVFLKELADGRVKLSLRSKHGVNVADVAKAFGGGGHAYAAGAVMTGPLNNALTKVMKTSRAHLI
jgi:phosphoesterase RecJ-like protein